jgi:hypothetical protein
LAAKIPAVTPRTRVSAPLGTDCSTEVSEALIGVHRPVSAWSRGTLKKTLTFSPTGRQKVPPDSISPSVPATSGPVAGGGLTHVVAEIEGWGDGADPTVELDDPPQATSANAGAAIVIRARGARVMALNHRMKGKEPPDGGSWLSSVLRDMRGRSHRHCC